MATVNGINQLQGLYTVDNNQVICRAIKNGQKHTAIALCTPADAWTKRLTVTGGAVMGKEVNCGDNYGDYCLPPNEHLKSNVINIGHTTQNIYIKFEKAKTFGNMSDYGTLTLPGADMSGLDIVFFWPNDSEGDAWNNFKNILNEANTVASSVHSIRENVLMSDEAAAQLMGSIIGAAV
jgi:hypothetical protein